MISRPRHDMSVRTVECRSQIGYYYESRDSDTPPVRTTMHDPLITFHLSDAMSAIYAWQASLTLLAPDE